MPYVHQAISRAFWLILSRKSAIMRDRTRSHWLPFLAYGPLLISCLLLLMWWSIDIPAAAAQERKTHSEASNSALELKIIQKIGALKEVKDRADYVRQHSNGQRKVVVAIYERPAAGQPWYWVKVWEDNGSTMVPQFNFYVQPRGWQIKVPDSETGALMDLATWRKKYRP